MAAVAARGAAVAAGEVTVVEAADAATSDASSASVAVHLSRSLVIHVIASPAGVICVARKAASWCEIIARSWRSTSCTLFSEAMLLGLLGGIGDSDSRSGSTSGSSSP